MSGSGYDSLHRKRTDSNVNRRKFSATDSNTRKKTHSTGANQNGAFQGVSKPLPRRNIFLGRVSKEDGAEEIKKHCANNGADVIQKEITKGDHTLEKFSSYRCW